MRPVSATSARRPFIRTETPSTAPRTFPTPPHTQITKNHPPVTSPRTFVTENETSPTKTKFHQRITKLPHPITELRHRTRSLPQRRADLHHRTWTFITGNQPSSPAPTLPHRPGSPLHLARGLVTGGEGPRAGDGPSFPLDEASLASDDAWRRVARFHAPLNKLHAPLNKLHAPLGRLRPRLGKLSAPLGKLSTLLGKLRFRWGSFAAADEGPRPADEVYDRAPP
jgi:hypothetical protein